MKQSEKELLSAILQLMDDGSKIDCPLEAHMEDEYGDEWLEFRDKYFESGD